MSELIAYLHFVATNFILFLLRLEKRYSEHHLDQHLSHPLSQDFVEDRQPWKPATCLEQIILVDFAPGRHAVVADCLHPSKFLLFVFIFVALHMEPF
jgi:hypothetical protein